MYKFELFTYISHTVIIMSIKYEHFKIVVFCKVSVVKVTVTSEMLKKEVLSQMQFATPKG